MQNYNSKSKTNKEEIKYRAYRFSIAIIKFIDTLPNKRVYWIMADQLLRAATSIGANIIEAQACSTKKDFTHFFTIALKSANETKYWLCLLRDGTETNKFAVNELLKEVTEISNILGASILTLKGKRENFKS